MKESGIICTVDCFQAFVKVFVLHENPVLFSRRGIDPAEGDGLIQQRPATGG